MPIAFPAPLAPYAAKAEETRGRLFPETESNYRSPFQRDRDRVVHSVAFRRLKHKTQVFIYHEGDYYRTRLTHSLEVAQIARTMARALKVDEDLAECVALAHDLGHPPFGHTGEDVLKECMVDYNGFDHNAQTLRLMTRLERRHATFDGMNLTWETLEGTVKHNGPLQGPGMKELPAAIVEYSAKQDLWLDSYASLEAQLAAMSDDIAYNNHDIDDGLRAGLFSFETALELPLFGRQLHAARKKHPDAPQEILVAESVSALIGFMVEDVIKTSQEHLLQLTPKSADDIRRAGVMVAEFSDPVRKELDGLRSFLMDNMYRHYEVMRARSQAKRIIAALFDLFLSEPETLPPEWHARYAAYEGDNSGAKLPRIVCDYIAGMTDRFAIREYERLFGVSAMSV